MYSRIMVAIDSDSAQGPALTTAVDLARMCGARLAVCHALDETIFARRTAEVLLPGNIGQAERQLADGALAFLEAAADEARAAGIDVDVRLVRSERVHAAEMIAAAAAEWRADLQVAAAHNRRGIERLFVGSFAEQLVRKVGASLLLVRGV